MKTVKKFIDNKNLKKRLFTPGPASLLYENITSIEPCFGRGDYQYQKIEDNVLPAPVPLQLPYCFSCFIRYVTSFCIRFG